MHAFKIEFEIRGCFTPGLLDVRYIEKDDSSLIHVRRDHTAPLFVAFRLCGAGGGRYESVAVNGVRGIH